jgi:predicted transcriptional regulator
VPKDEKKGNKIKSVKKGEAEDLILSALNEGKTRRQEILFFIQDKGKDLQSRTFSKIIKRLIEKGIVRRLGRGHYTLTWNISVEEAVKSIEQAFQWFASHGYDTIALNDISLQSGVPAVWKHKIGDGEVTFNDIVWGLSRKYKIKIGSEKGTRPVI